MPYVKNLNESLLMSHPIENPKWPTRYLPNVPTGPTPIDRSDLWKRLKYANVGHELVSNSYRGLYAITDYKADKLLKI